MADAITHLTREAVLDRYVREIMSFEKKNPATVMGRTYLLDLIAEVARALDGISSTETNKITRVEAGKARQGRQMA